MLRGKWAGGCRAAGLWSGAGIFTNAGYQARGIVVNQESPESDLGRRVPGGKATEENGKSNKIGSLLPLSGPCLSQISLPSPAVSCARIFDAPTLFRGAESGPLLTVCRRYWRLPPSTLGGDQDHAP